MVKIFGLIRSGGTVIYNIVNYLCDNKIDHQYHTYFTPDVKTLVVYRDFRDSCVSQWRVFSGNFNNTSTKEPSWEDLKHYSKQIKDGVEALNKFKEDYDSGNRNIGFLKYEEFFNSEKGDLDFGFLISVLEYELSIEVTEEQREYIKNNFSFPAHKALSQKYENFHSWDEKSGIHGNHLYKGKAGTWRDLVPSSLHDPFTNLFESELNQWGYYKKPTLGFMAKAFDGFEIEGQDLHHNKVDRTCTVYVEDNMYEAGRDRVKHKIGLIGCEPRAIQGLKLREWCKQNPNIFTDIIQDFPVQPTTWIKDKQIHNKTKNVSAIFSYKTFDFALERSGEYALKNKYSIGYDLRHNVAKEFKDTIDIFGNGYNPIDTKEEGTINYRYQIVIENEYNITGSEKLNDPIACGTVPIYWADNNSLALKFYNAKGIILFRTLEDLKFILENVISEQDYNERKPFIKQNFDKVCNLRWDTWLLNTCKLKNYFGG